MKALVRLDYKQDCDISYKGYQINNKERESNPYMEIFQTRYTQKKEGRRMRGGVIKKGHSAENSWSMLCCLLQYFWGDMRGYMVVVCQNHNTNRVLKNIIKMYFSTVISEIFSSVQLLSHVRCFATPWTHQASLFITNS